MQPKCWHAKSIKKYFIFKHLGVRDRVNLTVSIEHGYIST